MSRTRFAPFALALLLCAGFAAAASAAEEEVSCVDQIAALCPDTEPNTPQRRACVKEKRSKLSADCQKKLGPPAPPAPGAAAAPSGDVAKLEEMRPFFEACGGDREAIGKHCAGEKGQGNPLLQCIVDHKSEMSQKCVEVAQKHLAAPKAGTAPAK
jgi:hypothetical protein